MVSGQFIVQSISAKPTLLHTFQCLLQTVGGKKPSQQVAVYRPANPFDAKDGYRSMPQLRVITDVAHEVMDHVLVTALLLERERVARRETYAVRRAEPIFLPQPVTYASVGRA